MNGEFHLLCRIHLWRRNGYSNFASVIGDGLTACTGRCGSAPAAPALRDTIAASALQPCISLASPACLLCAMAWAQPRPAQGPAACTRLIKTVQGLHAGLGWGQLHYTLLGPAEQSRAEQSRTLLRSDLGRLDLLTYTRS